MNDELIIALQPLAELFNDVLDSAEKEGRQFNAGDPIHIIVGGYVAEFSMTFEELDRIIRLYGEL